MIKPVFLRYVLMIVSALTFSGCLSVSDSPVPRFYTLQAVEQNAPAKQFDLASKVIIGIGPIEIPEYQNRPQIVTRNKDGIIKFAQFERWGESLDAGLARLILEDLTRLLPEAQFQIFPCNFLIPIDFQVIINVIQLEGQLDKDLFLSTQWTVLDLKTKKMLLTKRTQIRQPINPHTYAGLAKALSTACSSLSEEIAENLSELSFKPEVKDVVLQ